MAFKVFLLSAVAVCSAMADNPRSYQPPAPSYNAPAPSYNAPSPSYSAPTPSYSTPSPSYNAPSPSYNAPSPSYNAPSPSYNAPSPSYNAAAPGPGQYNFNYDVKDQYSGNDFGHQESRDGYNTQGAYYIQVPDGRLQRVSYTVNGDSGYVAEVTYEGEAQYPQYQPSQGYQPAPQVGYA